MNKKHITRFMENKASFDKHTAKNQVPHWYALLYCEYAFIKDDKCEYPFTLFPHLRKDPELLTTAPQNDENCDPLNGMTDNGNFCDTTSAPNTLLLGT